MIPYPSIKAAIGAAAHLARPLAYPTTPTSARVQSVPDGEGLDRPIAVRAAMVRAGLEPDGEDAELLYRWATSTDEGGDDWDRRAETAETTREQQEALRAGAAERARLAALLDLLEPVLVGAGVVRRLPRPTLARVGYRVVRVDGRLDVQLVVDPSPADPTVLTGPDAERRAWRIARGEVDDAEVIVEQTVITSRRKEPELAAELGPAWERGEFATLLELDSLIAARIDVGIKWAAKIRASWGIHGSRGRAPTRSSRPSSQRPIAEDQGADAKLLDSEAWEASSASACAPTATPDALIEEAVPGAKLGSVEVVP